MEWLFRRLSWRSLKYRWKMLREILQQNLSREAIASRWWYTEYEYHNQEMFVGHPDYKKPVRPTPIRFGFDVARTILEQLPCVISGHDVEDFSTAGPDSGGIYLCCKRCGWEYSCTLY